MTELTLQQKMAKLKKENQESQVALVDVIKATEELAKAPVKQQLEKIAPVQQVPEKSYHVFHHTTESCKMITKLGRTISFIAGKYITDIQEEIEYLQEEIALGNMYLSVKEGQEVMTATDLDPMLALKKKHFEEFAAAQAEVARKIAAGESLSQSESEVQALTPGSTTDIANLAEGSSTVASE